MHACKRACPLTTFGRGPYSETQKYSVYQRKVQQQRHAVEQAAHKRKAENAARVSNGLPALPDEPAPAPVAAPSRLDALLVAGQIDHYATQITQVRAGFFLFFLSSSSLFLRPLPGAGRLTRNAVECGSVQFAGQSFGKLFLAQGLQGQAVPA